MTQQLASFFGSLQHIVAVSARAQRQLDRELATSFNATTLLQPNELRLSDIIACLLDSQEAHGQGRVFLDDFLDRFVEMADLRQADRSRCSVVREQGRLDILIELGSERQYAIGIENKPWAGERENQVRDYCLYLERYFPGRWWFGYLSGTGSPPVSIERASRENLEKEGRFRTIPFTRSHPADGLSIEDWLTRCIEVCAAERLRWFLRDMLDYVCANFQIEDGEQRP